LNQTEKIKKQRDFAAVLGQGKAWSAHTIRLIVRPNHLPRSRCGFVASKRLGNAVTRNRVRRRLRESMRLHYPHLQPGMDLVFIARRGAASAPFWELHRHVHAVLRRARLLPADYRLQQP
jgi:ribonuclease P protein component